jgi:hypothetical protein
MVLFCNIGRFIGFSTNLSIFLDFLPFFDHILPTFFLNCEISHRISIQIWKAGRLVFLNQHLDCFKKKKILEASQGKVGLWPNICPIFQILVYSEVVNWGV